MVVHGIPGKFKLSRGDVLSIDIGVVYDGWVADAARTFAGRRGLAGRRQAARGHRGVAVPRRSSSAGPATGSATSATPSRSTSRPRGFSIVRSLVGHGIGRDMHEEPQIPNYGQPGKGTPLEEGMVLAVEPMTTAGRHMVRMGDDGWAIYSQDGSLAAHFEFTVAITADGPRILTPWHESKARAAA